MQFIRVGTVPVPGYYAECCGYDWHGSADPEILIFGYCRADLTPPRRLHPRLLLTLLHCSRTHGNSAIKLRPLVTLWRKCSPPRWPRFS
jgi:hypothetical protein